MDCVLIDALLQNLFLLGMCEHVSTLILEIT